MRVEMAEIGVRFGKIAKFSIRKCYRLVCNHPFLVGILLFLFFLYRSFPFLFSLLVSTSPVLVCTAFLLGFLLSLGDPNIPEIEDEESVNHEIVSLRTEVQRDTTVVERDESFLVERYSGANDRYDSVDRVDGGLGNTGPLIEDYFTEIEPEGVGRGSHDPTDTGERFKNEEMVFLENQYSRIEEMDEESVGLLSSKSPMGSIESDVAERGDSPPASPWKQFGDDVADDDMAGRGDSLQASPWKQFDEGGNDVANEDSDSSSDRAESSSPDASMADILPLLDELHPLLNEETPLVSHGSDHSSHRSRGYKEISNDSDEESETHDDVDDEEERDGMGDAKDDESKPEITWTEDDQKNLMDLGTLELERNQRLESLIARRRARKLMVEKNLIDLNYDLPFTITPISTSRKNPFDLPYDSNENTGLPPIPGSAPSIMSQRRNPFDLPYDSSEEKPDLTTDSFQQEFSPLPYRETMFRRHESFNIGPSIFAPPKFDRDDFRFRPYFVAEGSSHSSFQRQTSELSDISKISSVIETETESICSVRDLDDKKILEEDVLEDVEMGSDLEDPSGLVGHGSESSEEEDVAEVREVEEREMEHDEVDMPSASLTRALSTIEEVHYSSGSSSSSLSEEHERAFDEEKRELSTNLELEIDKVKEQTDETKEPVYDLSPTAVRKNLSCSISSELLAEQTSEMDKTVVDFSDRQIDFCNESSTSGITVEAEQILDHGLAETYEKLDEHEDDRVKTSVRNDLVEEHLFSEDVVFQENEDQIHSSSSNAYSKWVSVEKPMDELHSFDKPVVNLSAEDHEELLEPPAVQLESIAEDHDEGNNLCEDHNIDQVTVQKPDFLEEREEIEEIDEGFLMELDNVGDFSIGELRSSLDEMPPVEDIDSVLLRTEPVPMKNEAEISSRMLVFEDEEDKSGVDEPMIEEIEADCCQIGSETENKTVFETIHHDEIDSEVHELEGTSLQGIDTACKEIIDDEKLSENIAAEVAEIGEETENKTVFELNPNEEIDSGMHELEATSLEDIDTAFKQIIDDENPVDVQSLPEKNEAEMAEISERTENKSVFEPTPYGAVDSGMHEVEATSVRDIDTDFKQRNDDKTPMIADSVDAEAEVAEIGEETENKTVFEIDSGMHELEAASIQDIEAAFRQINDKEIENPVVVDSLDSESLPEKVDAEVAEIGEETAAHEPVSEPNLYDEIDSTTHEPVSEPNLYDEIDSAMHELEATSVEDINTAFREINREEIEKPDIVKSMHAESLPEKSEAEVVEFSNETGNITAFEPIIYDENDFGMPELEATSLEDINTAFRQLGEHENPIIVESLDAAALTEKSDAEVAETSEKVENKIVFDPTHCDEIDSEMHELEATSIEDINTAFREINRETEIVESVHAESLPEKTEADVVEFSDETENKTVFEPIVYDKNDSGMHELEATSLEDINTAFRQLHEGENEKPIIENESLDAELTEKSQAEVAETSEEIGNKIVFEPTHHDEIDSGMHELEATSVEDINTAFREINREEVEIPDIVESVHAESLLEKNEADVVEFSAETENKTFLEPIIYDKNDSGMHELEATSLEDINTAFRQLHEGENEIENESLDAKLTEKSQAEVAETSEETENKLAFDSTHYDEIDSGMHELEATSVEDINTAFRQVSEQEVGEPNIFESPDVELSTEKVAAEVSEFREETEDKTGFEPIIYSEIDSGMHELEATSVEDINTAFRLLNEREIGKPAIVESFEAESLPEKIEAEVSDIEPPEPQSTEARYNEDNDLDNKQHNVLERYSSSFSEFFESHILEAEDKAEFFEANSDDALSQNDDLENSAVLEPIQEEEINSGMEQLEAQSLEDLYSSFRQIKENFENPIIADSLEADSVPEKSEAGVFEIGNDKSDTIEANDQAEEISSVKLEGDSKSVEYIDTVVGQIKEAENKAGFEQMHAEERDTGMKEFEARSLEDLRSAFRQIDKEEIETSVMVASLETDLISEKREVVLSELERPELPVVEARSIEDIGLAFQQVHNIEKFSKPLSENDKPDVIKAEDQAEEINYEMLQLDAQSIKDVDATSSSIKAAENQALFEPNLAETADVESKDLETRSLEDVYLTSTSAKEQLHEKVVSSESQITDLAPEESEAGVSVIKTREMPVVEADSIEDIGLAASEETSSSIPENINPHILETKNQEEIDSKMFKLDVQSVKDIDAECGLIKEVEKPAVSEPVPTETVESETKDFKARSLEHINLTFRHIKNEEVESPVSISTLISDLVSDKSEAEVSEIKAESRTQETSRSVEDVDTITSFDQINKVPNTTDLEAAHVEAITSGLKELEAQSLEDIESAFRQFKAEETEKPMVIKSLKAEAEISETGSTQNEPNLEETSKARSFEYVFIDKPSIETEDSSEPCSSLQVESENKRNSIEETDKLENQLKSMIEDESVGNKSNDVFSDEEAETNIKESTKAQQISGDFSEIESSVEISSLPENSTTGAKDIEPNIKVPSLPLDSDGLNSNFSDGKDKKKGKSHKSKSGSSSSSSSSDSD